MVWSSLIDSPIQNSDQDSLSLKSFASALSTFVSCCDTPITIGVQGDWGIGKTSLLYMIEDRLKPTRGRRKSTCFTVYFNTWQYAQFNKDECLAISIVNGIIRSIEERFSNVDPERSRKLKEYGFFALRVVLNIANKAATDKLGIDVKEALEADKMPQDENRDYPIDLAHMLQDYKNQFQGLVDSILPRPQDRLVIMIDDLDRIKPSRALELLEAIKLFLDVKGCVYVLAVDNSVIQQGVAEKFGVNTQKAYGRSFFDKIIQVPFNMPTSSYQMDRYIMSLLGWTFKAGVYSKILSENEKYFLSVRQAHLDNETVNYFTNVCQLTAGANPRSIKRMVNYANLLKIVCIEKRKGEGKRWTLDNAKGLFALACMQLAWKEVFTFFAENPTPNTLKKFQDWEFIEKQPELKGLLKESSNPDQLKSNISGFFDEMVGLVDQNGDGQITPQEFKPIWTMMLEANLTNAPLEDLEARWDAFKKLAATFHKGGNWKPVVDSTVRLFKRSHWNNHFRFRLVPAGKRFFNMLWDSEQIGSVVTTVKEPIQVYIKGDPENLTSIEMLKTFVKEIGSNHYGVGTVKVNCKALVDAEHPLSILNNLLEQIKITLRSS